MGGLVAYLLAGDHPERVRRLILGQITAETLVISGGGPSYIPQEWVVELAGQIPGAKLETIPVGHLIHKADPEAFTHMALGFLTA
jgi:3-oxoadipate enol-lactonase